MTILADHQIIKLARAGMIEPFVPGQVRTGGTDNKTISYGVGSYGYDIRLGYTILVAMPPLDGDAPIDPKVPDPRHFYECLLTDDQPFYLQPGDFVLGHSAETFCMPPDVIGVAVGKSTYARWGVNVIVTPLEAGWPGQLTLEIVNNGKRPVRLYPGEGIVQILFFQGEPCHKPYDSSRKYFGQSGVTLGCV